MWLQLWLHVVIVLYMETTTTTYKPVKIESGKYMYRGVMITKLGKKGFCATVFYYAGWYRLGLSTLAICVKDIDNAFSNGATLDGTKLSFLK